MYAKLVCSTDVDAQYAMRDIGRLISSPSPNVANLTGYGYSNVLSKIVDPTPAGWTYIGSTDANNVPSISTGSAIVTTGSNSSLTPLPTLAFSAPCLNGTTLKYCAFVPTVQDIRIYNGYTPGNSLFGPNGLALIGASYANSTGSLTNAGPYTIVRNGGGANSPSLYANGNFIPSASGSTVHVIANQRHITIINEEQNGIYGGLSAIWESSQTDAHTYTNTAPFIQYTQSNSSFAAAITLGSTTSNVIQPPTGATGGYIYPIVFNTYNINTGAYNGLYEVTASGITNLFYLAQYPNMSTFRQNTIGSTGTAKQMLTPIFYSLDALGYPTQMVTGVVPIYYTKPYIGVSGDTAVINGQTYTYINAGPGFGVMIQTS